MSFGQNHADSYRRAATYLDKMLKVSMSGDLPVQQLTKLELFINRKTASMFGFAIPQSILLRADKVTE